MVTLRQVTPPFHVLLLTTLYFDAPGDLVWFSVGPQWEETHSVLGESVSHSLYNVYKCARHLKSLSACFVTIFLKSVKRLTQLANRKRHEELYEYL